MANHEQAGEKPTIPALTARGAARRRIAGLGVSGVVMTVASNHAMASLVCKSPSGALSGNLASQAPAVACNGVSPGYWKNHPEDWPSAVKTSDLYVKYFACHGQLSNMSCMKVLTKQDADKNAVAMHIMATYLNVLSGKISFLTAQAVVDIWTKYNEHGGYAPTDGATPWTGEQLVAYLQSTQS